MYERMQIGLFFFGSFDFHCEKNQPHLYSRNKKNLRDNLVVY